MNAIKDLLTTPDYINTSNTDRILSALSGLAIIGVALSQKNTSTLSKWVKIGSGAVLILRAASGFCPVSKAVGLNNASSN
jgi:uncharacterized membrane protein